MTGKRNSQTISPIGSPSSGNISDGGSSSKEQDRFLPIANVSRIMKKSLPANAKISKEAKETVQECVSEFISFITGEASDKCQREKRKTINGDDLLWAMTTLGFENYVGPLKVYLNKYRESEGEKNVNSTESATTLSHGANTRDLQGFNDDYCLAGKSHGVAGYGENLASTVGFSMGKIHGLGDHGNAKRILAAHIQNGAEW
ncbi:hypothetical protein NMG60_11007230 [Bertholletia excelsa]